jgi:anti-sigma28 factor (negative regulator of flagellin synthesis)
MRHLLKLDSLHFRSIVRKERELRLLANITPENYLQYDKLIKNSSAKTIQRIWRSKYPHSKNANRSPHASKSFSSYKASKVNVEKEKEIFQSKENLIREQKVQKIQKFIEERIKQYIPSPLSRTAKYQLST